MLNIGPQELILVLIIALVVVGPSRLPELGRSIGKAMREFRKVQDEVKDTLRFDLHDAPEPKAPSPGPSRPATANDPTPNGEARAAPGAEDAAPAPGGGADAEPPVGRSPGDGAPEPGPSA